MDMWDTLGKCIAVALATLLLASIPEMLLLGSNKASQLVKLKDTMPGMTHCVSDEHFHSTRRKAIAYCLVAFHSKSYSYVNNISCHAEIR